VDVVSRRMTSSEGIRSVLLVGPLRGGAASVMRGAARALSARGWDVRLVELGDGKSPLREARRAFRRERTALRERTAVHVEHGSNDLAAFWFAIFAGRLRSDVVTVVHDAPLVVHAPGAGAIKIGSRWRDIVAHRVLAPVADKALRRAYARKVSVALVTSERAKAEWGEYRPSHTRYLPMAFDAPPASGAPSSGAHVLFAGYIGPSKGLEVLLDSWERIGGASPLPLMIAGDTCGVLGTAYLAGLHARCATMDAPPRWLGALGDDEFAQAFADASIVVVPYGRSNPASGIVLTAMAMGRAIAGTDVPALADFATDEREALIVPVGDADALAAALARLLADPALRDRLGAGAAVRHARDHNWLGHCIALERAYELAARGSPETAAT
jgi:glycosyltransferase involved in cell wall biosynthesis